MTLLFATSRSCFRCRAFTLVEMLVVLAIIAIMIAVSAPMVAGMMGGFQLDAVGQSVSNQLVLARQQARSGNHAVEVWFYELPDYSQTSSATPAVWRGIQAFVEGDPPATGNITLTPLTKPVFFPAPVIFSQVASPSPVSPLLTNYFGASTNTTAPVLPGYQRNYNYAFFRFRPDGSTDLGAGANSFTVVLENAALSGTNGLPKNYQTLQIDPIVGTVRSYRP